MFTTSSILCSLLYCVNKAPHHGGPHVLHEPAWLLDGQGGSWWCTWLTSTAAPAINQHIKDQVLKHSVNLQCERLRALVRTSVQTHSKDQTGFPEGAWHSLVRATVAVELRLTVSLSALKPSSSQHTRCAMEEVVCWAITATGHLSHLINYFHKTQKSSQAFNIHSYFCGTF